ncbi:class I SAM-dependent methyltransferase, partial [Zavarzinella formosa]|uniref:class I SAM-dependent methyltransferase n=1 Tax=Zavarzinella formosa TaxID=360055 RepID=UPI001EE64613
AGQVAEVVGVDCAAVNVRPYEDLRASLVANPDRLRFVCHDFSAGLGLFEHGRFDHAVSGLSISYAESWDQERREWTQTAYDRILAEVGRVLRPGGRFVFSVNVPSPSWSRVGLSSARSLITTTGTMRFLKKSWRMIRYGAWLKREARAGRFHYLPHAEVTTKLQAAGFTNIEHRVTYAGQAYLFRALSPS